MKMKYSAWNQFHAYYEGNKVDLYFKIISPRLRSSEVSSVPKTCLDNEQAVDVKARNTICHRLVKFPKTVVRINEQRMFMPWKKSVITSANVFFLPFCKHQWRHLFLDVFWSSPLLLSAEAKTWSNAFRKLIIRLLVQIQARIAVRPTL